MKYFQAIIFDMDGLLLDTERIALSAFLQACAELGIPPQQELFIRCIGTNQRQGREILKEGLRGTIDHQLFEKAWDRLYRLGTDGQHIPLKAGATELLAHIALLKKPIAVATSTATERAKEKLGNAGLLDFFDIIVGGDQVSKSKPEPDIYLRAAQLLRVPPTACLALEDSENGVRAALGAEMTVIQIPDLVEPNATFRELGHIILGSLSDVASHSFKRQ